MLKLKGLLKNLGKSKKPKYQSLTPADNALGSSPELTTSTSAITTSSAANPLPSVLPSVLAGTVTASVQVIQATEVTVSVA